MPKMKPKFKKHSEGKEPRGEERKESKMPPAMMARMEKREMLACGGKAKKK